MSWSRRFSRDWKEGRPESREVTIGCVDLVDWDYETGDGENGNVALKVGRKVDVEAWKNFTDPKLVASSFLSIFLSLLHRLTLSNATTDLLQLISKNSPTRIRHQLDCPSRYPVSLLKAFYPLTPFITSFTLLEQSMDGEGSHPQPPAFAHFISSCPNLKELRDSFTTSSAIIASIPPSVKLLGWAGSNTEGESSLEMMRPLIEKNQLENLVQGSVCLPR